MSMQLRLLWLINLFWLFFPISRGIPSEHNTRAVEFGLEPNDAVKDLREQFELTLSGDSDNMTYFEQVYQTPTNKTRFRIRIEKSLMKLSDDSGSQQLAFHVDYTTNIPSHLSYDMDSTQAAALSDVMCYWVPPATESNFTVLINVTAKQIGISYIRFWINEGIPMQNDSIQLLPWSDPKTDPPGLKRDSVEIPQSGVVGFPLIILRAQGVVQLIFRIVVVVMVSIFTFTMGCELDFQVLKSYVKRPVGPVIGFCCQFVIMPLLAFTIAKLVPIKREFGFGLLTIGCSPGGGASNAWSLMLGGDINLSIMMTFISSLSALFMMPLLLFIFGRFFIDVHRVAIPYGNIALQLLQISTPALLGLGLRMWKPKVAKRFTRLTRPLFIFFIIFFLTFGIYSNLSIFILIGAYPIVMPTSALLPWFGFALAALVAFLLRQPRALIITVALETGIQNVGAAILVLLYSMPQPAGDLGAVMPITVSIFTPVPLYFLLLALTIKRRCCKGKPDPVEFDEIQALRDKSPGSPDPKGKQEPAAQEVLACGDTTRM